MRVLIPSLFSALLLAAPLAVSGKNFSEKEVGYAIIKASKKYGIPTKSLFTLASIESDFYPLVLTIETTPQSAKVLAKLREAGMRVVTGGTTAHSKLSIVNIYPPDLETAQMIARELKRRGFCFDLGLMQINSVNFTLEEASDLFYPEKNIEKAARVFKGCTRRFKSLVHQVECYNRGAGNLRRSLKKGKHYYPYWKRFQRHYRRYFE